MTDPVISPDGKWMWTGTEWIPTPPTEESSKKETPSSFVNNMRGIKVQDSVITSNENIISITPIAVDRNKSTYVFIVLIILIGATVGGYLLMDRELEESSQDYWSNFNYGFRFTDDDVYVLVNSLEFENSPMDPEQECEGMIMDENWSLIEMDSGLCIFDSILFNATTKEDGYQTLCFASNCVRLDFEGDALYSTSISNDGNTNGDCHLSVRLGGSVNFSNSSVAENFSKRFSYSQTFLPAHCYSSLGLDDLHRYSLFPIHAHPLQMSTKVVLLSTVIADMTGGSENLFSTFKLALGSSPIYGADIAYSVACDNGGIESTFAGATIHTGDGATIEDPVINLNPGTAYVVDLDIAGCAPAANQDHIMIISVDGGRQTYEELQYGSSPNVGDVVV
jgi:hypothetical protein